MDPYNYPSLHEKNRTALFVFFVLNLVAEILLKYMLFNTLSKIKPDNTELAYGAMAAARVF